MGKDDVDMLDYQLYEITENPGTGETEAALVTLEYDPEEREAYMHLRHRAGSRYVMIYNRAYRVYFRTRLRCRSSTDTVITLRCAAMKRRVTNIMPMNMDRWKNSSTTL